MRSASPRDPEEGVSNPTYHSFLVRFQLEHDEQWHGEALHIQTGRRHRSTTMEALCAKLRHIVRGTGPFEATDEPSQP